MPLTIVERVKKGAAMLDRERPGWDEKVDTRSLNLVSSCNCVLGQVEGEYTDACRALGLDPFDVGTRDKPGAVDYGFILLGEDDQDDNDDVTWAELEGEWKKLIHKRVMGRP